jgi:hypothetical protein
MTSSQNIVTIHDVTMMMTFCFSKEIKFSEFAFSPFAYMKDFVDFFVVVMEQDCEKREVGWSCDVC